MTIRWSEARTAQEREAAIRTALHSTNGNVKRAADLLAVSRRQLTRVLGESPWLREMPETGETSMPTGTPRLSGTTETPSLIGTSTDTNVADAGETPSRSRPLTYLRSVPSFRGVTSAPTMTDVDRADLANVEIYIKKSNADRLEMEALREKQRTGASRMSKSVVVEAALEAYWQLLDKESGR